MCRFFATQIFFHPRLFAFDYYMRLDTDSYIQTSLCYDPIDKLHRSGKVYGYKSDFVDEPYVVREMWNFVDEFARNNSDVETQLEKNKWPWPEGRGSSWGSVKGVDLKYDGVGVPSYYNNFEIVKIAAFQTPEVQRFYNAIMMDPGHFYNLRWGESLLPIIL